MHELAITEHLLNVALKHADEGSRITDLYIVVGELSSVVDDSVQFFWDIISEGTMAEGATLHFERIPMTLTCQTCDHSYHPTGASFDCPSCGGTDVAVTGGEIFQLQSMEVEPCV